MDSPNKKKLANGIRTRSSRDSSVDDLADDRLKGCSTSSGDAKPTSGVSTRHHTRGCDAQPDNGKNLGLEFPMGRRRRKFPKITSALDEPLKFIGARIEAARTKPPERQLPPLEKPHTRNGDRKKTEKPDAVAQRRPFGQRRRKRSSASKDTPAQLEPCGVKLERLPLVISDSSEKNVQCDQRVRGDDPSSLDNSSLDGADPCIKEDSDSSAKRRGSSEGTSNCRDAQKTDSHSGLSLNLDNKDDGHVLQERKRIRSGEDVNNAPMSEHHDAPDCVLEAGDPGKSHVNDEQSLSSTLSNDGDSRDSTEQENRSKDRSLSAHEADSDDGSIATTDSRSSAGRQRRKSDQGNSHRTGIDFRVGGRLEARDYLNMWYPSRIIQVDWDDKEVLIHFERWNSRFDEWVSMDSPRLRAITRTSTRKEKKDCPFPEYKVGEVILAKWTDCKMYPAKISKINSDLSYNVLFYDGFERLVQYINIKKLPSDFSGDLNFKESPPKSEVKRKRSTSGSKKEDETVKDDEKEKTKSPSLKNKVEPNKGLLDKDCPSGEKQKPKSVSSPPSSSNHKGNGTALPNKRRKLLVGGIFQAKRHQLAVKIGGNLSKSGQSKTSEKTKGDVKLLRGNKKPEMNSTEKVANETDPLGVLSAMPNLSEPDFTKANDSLASGFAPCKAFVIEEDHNHFKCLVEGCGKAFRKDVLLASHMKHYHTVKRKPNVDKPSEKQQEPVENTAPIGHQPSEQAAQLTTKSEVNLERKLITEKRRQRLLQKKLDKQHNQAAAALLLQEQQQQLQQQQQLAKQSKKPQGPPEIKEENVENSPVNKLPVKSERPKTRKRKYFLTARGVVAKLKRRRLEGEAKAKGLDGDLSQQNLSADGTESEINPHLEPLSSKMFLKLKRKQRFDPILSSDESEKSTTTSTCDSTETCEDKALIAKLGKEFGIYRSGQNVMGSSWGGNCELRDEVVNCRCQVQEEDGLMMQCEVCLAWQHGACFDIEDEDKVPEKYVCFACENPKGQRQSFRYKHNQDWFKLGELATFRFLPKRDTWSLKENMLKTHNLASQLISFGSVLHALQCKMQIAKEPKHSSLVLWAQPWQDSKSNLGSSSIHKKPFHFGYGNPASGQNGCWAFGDHSYSVPNRGFSQNEFVDPSCAFLAEQCDDKNLCFDVAANEVLDVQGMGPPLQEEVVETCVATTDPKLKDCLEKVEPNNETGLAEVGLGTGTTLTENDCVPKEEPGHHNHEETIKEEKDENVHCPPSIPVNNTDSKDAQICNAKTATALDKQKLKERRIFFPPNSKKSVTEAFDVRSYQLNLLDHVEHLQEELDRRLDELNQQLEFLESDFESPSLSSSDDTLADIPRVKKLLKTIGNDLVKVQRMTLYC